MAQERGRRNLAWRVLLDKETGKASKPLEIEDEAFLVKILVESSSEKLKVGTPIAILVEEEENVEKFKDYKEESAATAREPE